MAAASCVVGVGGQGRGWQCWLAGVGAYDAMTTTMGDDGDDDDGDATTMDRHDDEATMRAMATMIDPDVDWR